MCLWNNFLSINRTHLKTNIKHDFFFLISLKLYSLNPSVCWPCQHIAPFDTHSWFMDRSAQGPLEESWNLAFTSVCYFGGKWIHIRILSLIDLIYDYNYIKSKRNLIFLKVKHILTERATHLCPRQKYSGSQIWKYFIIAWETWAPMPECLRVGRFEVWSQYLHFYKVPR